MDAVSTTSRVAGGYEELLVVLDELRTHPLPRGGTDCIQLCNNTSCMPTDDFEQSGAVVTEKESKTKLERPPLYRVLLHNDHFTTMEFVVFVLQTIFGHNEANAIRIMLNVHKLGIGLSGVYTYEVAEMKVEKVTSLAQANEFPLLCTMEEDETDN